MNTDFNRNVWFGKVLIFKVKFFPILPQYCRMLLAKRRKGRAVWYNNKYIKWIKYAKGNNKLCSWFKKKKSQKHNLSLWNEEMFVLQLITYYAMKSADRLLNSETNVSALEHLEQTTEGANNNSRKKQKV